uniref:hypothetical protein n=1 Tax=Pseudomonas aeruginosa TaxID=287 RepID=UPI00093A9E72|nr:hypothetical protein [Pseudomonas aeruginosa]
MSLMTLSAISAQVAVRASRCFGVFAKASAGSLEQRRAAAKEIEMELSAIPESQVNSPVRVDMLESRLASAMSKSHREVTLSYYRVSNLLNEAEGSSQGHVAFNIDRMLAVNNARSYNSQLIKLLNDGADRASAEVENCRLWRELWIKGARHS